jgi:ssDNA-binding Zn-finger/Zn-ribbon topoisomerase 1
VTSDHRNTTALAVTGWCPDCDSPLRVRTNRSDGTAFIGCTTFPACRFTQPLLPALAHRVRQLQDELDDQRALGVVGVDRDLALRDLDRALRDLAALAHPDRWPDNELAHEVTVRLLALRDALRVRRAA